MHSKGKGSINLEQNLAILMLNTDENYVLVDTNLNIVSYNKKFVESMVSYFGEKVTRGESILKFVSSNTAVGLRAIYEKVFAGKIEEYEFEIMLPDKSKTSTFFTRLKPAYDDNNNIIGAFVSSKDITDSKKIEGDLRQTTENFKLVVENAYQAFLLSTPEGNIIDANKAAEEMFGYSKEELKSMNSSSLVDSTDNNYSRIVSARFEKGKAQGEITAVRKNGERFTCEITSVVFEDVNGGIKYSTWTNDVSARKAAEERIKQSEMDLRAIFDNSIEAFLLSDIDGTIKAFNSKAKEFILLNHNNVEIEAGRNIFDYIKENEQEQYRELIGKVINGETIKYDKVFVREDEKNYWFHFSLSPVRNDNKITGICISGNDITDRKTTEKRLDENITQINNILESITDGFIAVDTNWTITYWNNKAEEILSAKKSDVLGKNLWEVYKDAIPLKFYSEYMKAVSQQMSTHFEEYYPTMDLWIDVSAYPTEKGLSVYFRDISERKNAEAQLIRNNKQLATSQQIAHVGYWEYNLIDESLYWSEEMYKIHGLNLDSPITIKTFLNMIHSEDRERVLGEFLLLFQNNSTSESEFRIIKSDGSLKNAVAKASAVADHMGASIRLEGTLQDITDRKIEENKLRESEEKYKMLFTESPLPKWIYDMDTLEILEVNNAAERNYGYSREEFLKMSIKDIHTSEDVESFTETVKATNNTGTTQFGHWKHKKKNDEEITVEVTGHAISFNNRRAMMAIAIDISESLRTRQELIKSNDRYKYATKVTSDAIWDWNLVTQELYYSEGYQKLFGYDVTLNQANIQTLIQRIHPDDQPTIRKYIEKKLNYVEGDVFWEIEYRFIKSDGTVAFIHDKASTLFNEKKEAVRVIGAMQDITSRKQFEHERDKMTTDLIQRNKDLEQFAYIVSHNLRSPVANILGCIQIITDPTFDDETKREITEGLSIAANKMDAVILDLNNILQLKQNVIEQYEEISFNEIIDEIKTSIAIQLEKERAIIITDFSEVAKFRSLKTYLYSIFFNLITNSIKYKKLFVVPKIEIKTIRLSDSFEILFKDNGLGMDLNNKESKVFGLYKRFHHHVEGKGMGLFMVKTQVEALGGKIQVKSEVDRGTEFRITFPIPAK